MILEAGFVGLAVLAAALAGAAGWGWGLSRGRQLEADAWKTAYYDALNKPALPVLEAQKGSLPFSRQGG
jgi:hypothetical protein